MDYGLDAAVALQWSFNEQGSADSDRLLPRLIDGTDRAYAPALLLAEVGHNLRKHRFQRNVPAEEIWDLWADFIALPIRIVPIEALIGNAFALSNQRMITTYDALYAQLAIERRIPLLTNDDGLLQALSPLKLGLHVRDFPFETSGSETRG